MSNTITIKHGASAPSNGTLQPFELGYVTSTGTLVIGDSNKNTKNLNYLQLNADGTLSLPGDAFLTNGRITLDSQAIGNPKIFLTNKNHTSYPNAKISLGMLSSQGICQIIHWGQDAEGTERYEIFRFPQYESPMPSKNETYYVLTSKGGSFAGNFKFTDSIAVDASSYGTTDPNTAGKTGQVGQLYFVIAE